MLKKDSFVKVKEVIEEKEIVEEVLKRTTWKAKVLITLDKYTFDDDDVYKIVWIKNEYVVISSGYKYFLTKINSLQELYKGQEVVLMQSYGQVKGGLRAKIYWIKEGNSSIGLDFERVMDFGHKLNGLLEHNTGYYVPVSCLEPYNKLEELKEKENSNIIKLTSKIEELTSTLERKERFQDLMNEAVIEKGKEIAIEDLKEKLKKDLDTFIQDKYGVLPKQTIEIKDGDYKKKLDGIFHKEFENICRIVKSNIPLMLVGSAGAGKNYTLEQVAKALDLDFYFSNAVNQEYKLTGFIDANGKYHETEFYKAFTKGGMFFLDEIDASCPECLVILNSAIANRYFDFPTGRVVAHENFRVVCAGNTYGTGADMVYVGRNVLDGATLDRFVVLPFDYDEEVEKQLAYDEELYTFINKLRKAINEAGLRYIVSMRALINSSKLLQIGMSKKDILKISIIKNMQIDDLNNIVKKINYSSEWVDELKKMCD